VAIVLPEFCDCIVRRLIPSARSAPERERDTQAWYANSFALGELTPTFERGDHDRQARPAFSTNLQCKALFAAFRVFQESDFPQDEVASTRTKVIVPEQAVLDMKACPSLTAEDLGNLQSALYAKV
jgi:hypothetical protein